MAYKVLILNLGSTSTKIAVYEDLKEKDKIIINHPTEELQKFENIWDQEDYRKEKILEAVKKNGYDLNDFDAFSCRGGNVKPVPGGIYILNEEMIADMRSGKTGVHPTNVGNSIAFELANKYNKEVITADPPVTDEFDDLARFSGIKELERISSFQALNQKRIAKKLSQDLNKNYKDTNLIIVHFGGGISVAAHKKGRVVEVNNALDGGGPFGPERAGNLPVGDLIKMCFSGKYNQEDMMKKIRGGGGLVSYLGTSNGLEVEKMIENGDQYALKVFEAMAYQTAREIGAAAVVLKGNVDAIGFTGGYANSQRLIKLLKEWISFIADIYIYPGENEMLSLAENAYKYLNGEVKAKKY